MTMTKVDQLSPNTDTAQLQEYSKAKVPQEWPQE